MDNDKSTPNQQQAEQDPCAISKPDWEAWGTVKQTQLWCAACLANNIDPSYFRFKDQRMPIGFRRYPAQMADLISMAKGNIGANGILRPVAMNGTELEECDVNLTNFTSWLTSFNFSLPNGYPWTPEKPNFAHLTWPWGQHSTALLRNLAEVGNALWKHYDPTDPTTAPKSEHVISWLKDRGVSDNMAKAMATILRADGLSTGPRR